MDSSIEKINMTGILQYLDGSYQSGFDTPYLFINHGGSLETFFTYKGSLIELNKYSLEIKLKTKSLEEVEEEIRQKIVVGLKTGEWVVFSGGSTPFGYEEFLKQFKFFTKDFFKNLKISDKKFLVSSGILKKSEDSDFYGNNGFYRVNDNAKIIYLSSVESKDVENLKSKNANVDFKLIMVQ